MAFPVHIVVNGLSGPRCHVEANSESSIREVHRSIWRQTGVPVYNQILLKDETKLLKKALVGSLVAAGPEEKHLALTLVVQEFRVSVLVVVPLAPPKHFEYLTGAVEETIDIRRLIPTSEIMCRFSLTGFHEKLDMKQPGVLFLCCHREEEQIFLGKESSLYISDSDFVQIFATRAEEGLHNPAFVIFSMGGSEVGVGNKLPEALVDCAVGIDLVVYWLGEVPDEVNILYSKLLAESLMKMEFTEEPVEGYYRSHKAAVEALPDAIEKKFRGVPDSQGQKAFYHDSVKQIRCYPDPPEVATSASPSALSSSCPTEKGTLKVDEGSVHYNALEGGKLILFVAPLDPPRGQDILYSAVEGAIDIARNSHECDVLCEFERTDFAQRLNWRQPQVMFLCCYREEERLFLGKKRHRHLSSQEFLDFFRQRAEVGLHNPACVIFSTRGVEGNKGSKLPQALVDHAVGVDFVVYWLGIVPEDVANLYSKLLAQSLLVLKMDFSEDSVQRYYRSHKEAVETLPKALDEKLQGVPDSQGLRELCHGSIKQIRCYPDPES